MTFFLMEIILYTMIYLTADKYWDKIEVRIMLGWMFVAGYWLLNSVYFAIVIKELMNHFKK